MIRRQNKTLALVSAGLTRPKKRDHAYARQILYLNYGLLGLGSILKEAGYNVRVYHGMYEDPTSFADRLQPIICQASELLLSLPSFYCIDWAERFCGRIRQIYPSMPITAGGRWVLEGNGQWLSNRLPMIDRFIGGLADTTICTCVSGTENDAREDTGPGQIMPWLDYSLLDQFSEFTPSIEFSRGCKRGCEFCCERKARTSGVAISDPADIANRLKRLNSIYPDGVNRYLEASLFDPTEEWVAIFCAEYLRLECRSLWRCETRADALSSSQIAMLGRHGLRVIDLGLESASHAQLRRMGKAGNPERYLKMASELLQSCYMNGIWVKVNVMLYPGENRDTLAETEDWLSRHERYIKGISAYPLVVYGPNDETLQYLQELAPLGAVPVSEMLSEKGYTFLHLSKTIDYGASIEESERISRRFMTSEDYWDLKHFNYFRRSYGKHQFLRDIQDLQEGDLSFRKLRRMEIHPPSPADSDMAG